MVPPFLQPYILKTRRCMEVKKDNIGDNRRAQILIRHYDINSGPLAPIIGFLFRQPIVEGFDEMTRDLKKYIHEKLI